MEEKQSPPQLLFGGDGDKCSDMAQQEAYGGEERVMGHGGNGRGKAGGTMTGFQGLCRVQCSWRRAPSVNRTTCLRINMEKTRII